MSSRSSLNAMFRPPAFPSREQPIRLSQDMRWQYTDRRTMQEITPGIYLGPLSAARDTEALDQRGITILVAARTALTMNIFKPRSPEKYRYEYIDIVEGSLLSSLPRVHPFVSPCLARGERILFYDETGNTKAAALVCGFLMESSHLSSQAAYGLIKSKRLSVSLDEHEQYQLAEYETLLQARNNVISHVYSKDELSRTSTRRKHESISGEDEQMSEESIPEQHSAKHFSAIV